jgi:lysophospholipase
VQAGRVRLRAARFPAAGSPRGSVVLSPGRTEPIEKYFEVIGELTGRGFAVLAHDWCGQGLSTRLLRDGLRGHAVSWRRFLREFGVVLDAFEGRLPKPWIAIGHSMGGGLTALALAEGERRFAGAALSAPMTGVKTGSRAPGEVRLVAKLMRLVGRGGALPLPPVDPARETFDTNVLTHDRARWERARAQVTAWPELALGGPTWSWLSFALELSARLKRRGAAEAITIPVAVLAAGQEELVDNADTRAFAARLPHGRFELVEGARHELLMETDELQAAFWRAFDRLADEAAPRA